MSITKIALPVLLSDFPASFFAPSAQDSVMKSRRTQNMCLPVIFLMAAAGNLLMTRLITLAPVSNEPKPRQKASMTHRRLLYGSVSLHPAASDWRCARVRVGVQP